MLSFVELTESRFIEGRSRFALKQHRIARSSSPNKQANEEIPILTRGTQSCSKIVKIWVGFHVEGLGLSAETDGRPHTVSEAAR